MRRYDGVNTGAWQALAATLALLSGDPTFDGLTFNELQTLFRYTASAPIERPLQKSNPREMLRNVCLGKGQNGVASIGFHVMALECYGSGKEAGATSPMLT